MARFVTYFTMKGVWRSCDVVEVGSYTTEQAAMMAGQQHAMDQRHKSPDISHRLVWERRPPGLTASNALGRYDIRKTTVVSPG